MRRKRKRFGSKGRFMRGRARRLRRRYRVPRGGIRF